VDEHVRTRCRLDDNKKPVETKWLKDVKTSEQGFGPARFFSAWDLSPITSPVIDLVPRTPMIGQHL